jgi:thiol-disulfide isomerase/thioredoxin
LPHAAPTSAPRGSTSTPAAAAPDVDLLGDPEQALAGNAAQADQLVGEGAADLKTRLAALRGHPVVVNQWGSWCPPCRAEFPFFARAASSLRQGAATAKPTGPRTAAEIVPMRRCLRRGELSFAGTSF